MLIFLQNQKIQNSIISSGKFSDQTQIMIMQNYNNKCAPYM